MPKSPFDKQFGRQGIKNPSVTPSTYPRDLGATLWLNGQYKKGTVSERARDISGYGNHGTIYSGRAMQFDGVADRIDISSVVGPFSKFTAAAWFQTDSALLMNIWSSSVVDAGNYVGTQSGKIAWFNGVAWMVSPATYNDGLPHRVAYIFDEGVYRIAVDGEIVHEEDSGTYTDGRFQYIGRLSGGGGSRFWLGELADCQIWSEAWDADDVLYDYQNPEKLASDRTGTALTTSDLAGWWPMVDGLNDADWDLVLDASGNGNHGTNVSAGAAHLTGLGSGWPQMVYRGWSRRYRTVQDNGVGDYVEIDLSGVAAGVFSVVVRAISDDSAAGTWRYLFDARLNSGVGFTAIAGNNVLVGSNGSIYVDGVQSNIPIDNKVTEYVITGINLTLTDGFRVFASNTGFQNFQGVTLEFAIFSGTWDADDVAEAYASGDFIDLAEHSLYGNCVGHWRNTGRATWEDLSGNGNDGTVNGSPDAIYIPESPGSTVNDGLGFPLTNPRDVEAFNWDGASRIVIPYSANLGAVTGDVTVLAAIYLNEATGQKEIISAVDSGFTNTPYELQVNGLQPRFVQADAVDNESGIADTLVSTLTWYIAGAGRAGVELTHYRNGGSDGTYTFTTVTDPTSNGRDIYVGNRQVTPTPMNGLIGDVVVIPSALTADQVADLYNALKGKYGL